MLNNIDFQNLENSEPELLILQVSDTETCIDLGKLYLGRLGGSGSTEFDVMRWEHYHELDHHPLFQSGLSTQDAYRKLQKKVRSAFIEQHPEWQWRDK